MVGFDGGPPMVRKNGENYEGTVMPSSTRAQWAIPHCEEETLVGTKALGGNSSLR